MALALTFGYMNYNKTFSDALFLANIEALTNDSESGGSDKKQKLVNSGNSCIIQIPLGNGAYIRQDGTYYTCNDDPQGYSDCRNACVANK